MIGQAGQFTNGNALVAPLAMKFNIERFLVVAETEPDVCPV